MSEARQSSADKINDHLVEILTGYSKAGFVIRELNRPGYYELINKGNNENYPPTIRLFANEAGQLIRIDQGYEGLPLEKITNADSSIDGPTSNAPKSFRERFEALLKVRPRPKKHTPTMELCLPEEVTKPTEEELHVIQEWTQEARATSAAKFINENPLNPFVPYIIEAFNVVGKQIELTPEVMEQIKFFHPLDTRDARPFESNDLTKEYTAEKIKKIRGWALNNATKADEFASENPNHPATQHIFNVLNGN